MGLGSPETDRMAQRLLAESLESGIIGGRISGGGAGGTVIVIVERRALATVEGWAREMGQKLIF
jgi:galactokinase